MSKRDANILLKDMLESIELIKKYVSGLTFEQFNKDQMVKDAVVRNLSIIGEAGNRVPVEFKDKYNFIEWKRIIGLRNIIIHDYFGIDYEIIWRVIEKHLDPLQKSLEEILKEK